MVSQQTMPCVFGSFRGYRVTRTNCREGNRTADSGRQSSNNNAVTVTASGSTQEETPQERETGVLSQESILFSAGMNSCYKIALPGGAGALQAADPT